ncbi:hypothetical protein [Pedobacter sp. P26]|uniref:hypothetical protein n=1 Tax=Pedobacter sp. P26 TaxID=3423956 RepID=UPI003D6683A4
MKGERQISFDGTSANANMRGGGGDGINTRNALGINYKNEFSTKLSADAAYNFNNNKNNTISTTYTQSVLQDAGQNPINRLENANSISRSNNNNHWFGGNLEYKIDTMNYLKISPNFSYSNNSGNSAGGSEITEDTLATNRQSTNFNTSKNINAHTNFFLTTNLRKRAATLLHGEALTIQMEKIIRICLISISIHITMR